MYAPGRSLPEMVPPASTLLTDAFLLLPQMTFRQESNGRCGHLWLATGAIIALVQPQALIKVLHSAVPDHQAILSKEWQSSVEIQWEMHLPLACRWIHRHCSRA